MTSDHPGESNIGAALFLTVVWALVIMMAARVALMAAGTLYFALASNGGSESAFSQFLFLFDSLPLLLLASFGLGWWLTMRGVPVRAKLGTVIAFLFLYGLFYVFTLNARH